MRRASVGTSKSLRSLVQKIYGGTTCAVLKRKIFAPLSNSKHCIQANERECKLKELQSVALFLQHSSNLMQKPQGEISKFFFCNNFNNCIGTLLLKPVNKKTA